MKNIARKVEILLAVTVLIFGLLLSASAFSLSPEVALDINGNGTVNVADARFLLRFALGLEKMNPPQSALDAGILVFGDINGDFQSDIIDARILLKYTLGLTKFEDLTIRTRDNIEEPTEHSTEQPTKQPTEQPTEKPTDIPVDPGNKVYGDEDLPKNVLLDCRTDHGLGDTKTLIVKNAYAENMPLGTVNDISSPKYIGFTAGTIDYLAGIEKISGNEYACGISGFKTDTEDVVLVENAYKLPPNEISVVRVQSTGKATEIFIKTKWQVPVQISLLPQEYYTGANGRPFHVKDFTATGIDIKFAHTTTVGENKFLPLDSYLGNMSMSVSGTAATMHLDFDSPEDFNGIKIEMTKNGYFKLTFNYRKGGIDGKVIVLDPGHGGVDPGGGAYGVFEGPINAKIMKLVGEKLIEAGAVVVNTNPDYKDVSLEERKMIARKADANLFISLHGNAATSTNVSGAEAYYFFPFSKQLAADMQDALVSALKQVYSPIEANYEKVDRGEKYWGFSVCRLECCPSVLLEYEYLTNARAREIMQLTDTHEKIATAMTEAIINYFDYE